MERAAGGVGDGDVASVRAGEGSSVGLRGPTSLEKFEYLFHGFGFR